MNTDFIRTAYAGMLRAFSIVRTTKSPDIKPRIKIFPLFHLLVLSGLVSASNVNITVHIFVPCQRQTSCTRETGH